MLALAGLANGQTSTTGQIAGDVTDPTGAVLANAKVVAVNDAGIRREVTSDAAGRYAFPLLPPGRYTVEITAQGFSPLKVAGVNVRITETSVVDLALKVAAAAAEVLQVTAQPPLVQSESATAGRVIEQDTIRQLPLPTRNFQQLLTLTPGATSSLQNSSDLGRGDTAITVNGARTTSNSVVINGIDANAIGTGSTPSLAVPATDALQEFIVQTSLYDATQGRAAGGIIAAVTKSGTNAVHGNAYMFLRDDSLNANNYFLNRQGIERPLYERKQFGGTLGGPVVKDRAWFFLSYQGTREKNGTSLTNSLATVFTPGNLTDDRSLATIAAANDLPAVLISPVALNILQAKLPDGSYLIPSAGSPTGNRTPVARTIPTISEYDENQANLNFDFKVNDSNQLAVKLFGANNPTTQGLYSFAGIGNGPLQAPGAPTSFDLRNRVASVSDTWIISPRILNDARFGYSEIFGRFRPDEPFSGADFGITQPLSSLYPGAPTIDIQNMMSLGPSPLADQMSQNKTFTASDMLTWSLGRHTVKFGGDFKHHEVNLDFRAYTRGYMLFSAVGAVDSWTMFLMGMPLASIQGSGVTDRSNRSNDFATFVQDDWRVTDRLTLNMGLRFDYYGPFYEKDGRFVAFDPVRAQMTPARTLSSGFVQAGNGNLPGLPKLTDGLVESDKNNFGPRVGFAYKPFANSDKFVVRGGYGLYYDRANSRLLNSQVFNSPYYTMGVAISGGFVVPSGATFVPGFLTAEDPFLRTPLPGSYPMATEGASYPFAPGLMPLTGRTAFSPLGPKVTANPLLPNGVVPASGIYPDVHNFKTPYIHQYNLGFQWEIVNNYMLDLSFVGSSGRKLSRLHDLNPQPAAGAFTTAPYYPAVSSFVVPTVGAFSVESSGVSNYNSLQASLTKRYSYGLQFMASYTYSHALDNYSGGDVNDLVGMAGDPNREYYATSDFDRRHRLVVSYVYDLPKFYTGGSGALRRFVNDWQVAGITTVQTGTPFSIVMGGSFLSNAYAVPAAGVAHPTEMSGDVKDRLGEYFETSDWVAPAAGQWGSARNVLRGPAQTNVDFSIVKFIPVTETQKFEFRTEFFNLLNTTNFANPVNVRTSANFGQIVRSSTGPRVVQFAFKYSF